MRCLDGNLDRELHVSDPAKPSGVELLDAGTGRSIPAPSGQVIRTSLGSSSCALWTLTFLVQVGATHASRRNLGSGSPDGRTETRRPHQTDTTPCRRGQGRRTTMLGREGHPSVPTLPANQALARSARTAGSARTNERKPPGEGGRPTRAATPGDGCAPTHQAQISRDMREPS